MSARRLDGATALVTGAGSGLGRTIALRFAREGAAGVAVVDRVADRVDAVVEEVRQTGATAVAIVADLEDPAACDACVARTISELGTLDIAVANAAISSPGEPSIDMELASWNRMIAVNLTATFLIARAAARHMIPRRTGSIIFTASVGGMWGQPGGAHYSVTKAAVINLAKTLALEWGRDGIRVNSVSPGGMDTNMIAEYQGEEAAARQRAGSVQSVLGRIAHADEVAAAFAFLASGEGSYVTGVNLVVDGGVTAGVPPLPRA
jgi:NAD(P)-dependent dehydrogenase (short-subunit alcohol dehydrogenase family)